MKDNIKFLSILFILQARMKGSSATVFPDKPITLDGKRYVGASVNNELQNITLAESDGENVTALLTVDGSEDWNDKRWDALRDGVLRATCAGRNPNNRLVDEDHDMLVRCIDLAFNQGKAVESARPKYILTCITGEGKLASAEVFSTPEKARKAMGEQVLSEKMDLENSGYDNVTHNIEACHAVVAKDGEPIYTWDITKTQQRCDS